jgi:hypothetical protein
MAYPGGSSIARRRKIQTSRALNLRVRRESLRAFGKGPADYESVVRADAVLSEVIWRARIYIVEHARYLEQHLFKFAQVEKTSQAAIKLMVAFHTLKDIHLMPRSIWLYWANTVAASFPRGTPRGPHVGSGWHEWMQLLQLVDNATRALATEQARVMAHSDETHVRDMAELTRQIEEIDTVLELDLRSAASNVSPL